MNGKAAPAKDGAELLGGGGAVTGGWVEGVEGVAGVGPEDLGGGVVELAGGGVAAEEGAGAEPDGGVAVDPAAVTLMASFWPKLQC